jgi:hypothetical protein
MPQSLLKKIGKCGTDLKRHNRVLSNYEGNTGFSLGALQVNLTVGSITTVKSQLQLTLRKRMDTWNRCRSFIYALESCNLKDDSLVESVEADQSYFFAEVNHVTRKTFGKSLDKIAPMFFC